MDSGILKVGIHKSPLSNAHCAFTTMKGGSAFLAGLTRAMFRRPPFAGGNPGQQCTPTKLNSYCAVT